MSSLVRKSLRFYGEVQGVGFRYRAKRAAVMLGLTGNVHNEWDGTVYMEVQGGEEQIRELLDILKDSPFIRIEGLETKILEPVPGERSFRVQGY